MEIGFWHQSNEFRALLCNCNTYNCYPSSIVRLASEPWIAQCSNVTEAADWNWKGVEAVGQQKWIFNQKRKSHDLIAPKTNMAIETKQKSERFAAIITIKQSSQKKTEHVHFSFWHVVFRRKPFSLIDSNWIAKFTVALFANSHSFLLS